MATKSSQPRDHCHILEDRFGPLAISGTAAPRPSQHDSSNPPYPASTTDGSMSLPGPSSLTSKRRFNQAQRRQMSSQLSIPIDQRPLASSQHNGYAYSPRRQTHGHYAPLTGQPKLSSIRAVDAASAISWTRIPAQNYYEPSWNSPSPCRNTSADSSRPQTLPHHQHQRHYTRPDQPIQYGPAPHDQPRNLLKPHQISYQASFLEKLYHEHVAGSEIEIADIAEKEAFRQRIESLCRDVISRHEQLDHGVSDFTSFSVDLRCFGSLSSGFATKASDMDLGLLSPLSTIQPDAPGSPIPRLLEKALLNAGFGARLLSRTRVPIIKLCERPPASLHSALLIEHQKMAEAELETGETVDDELSRDQQREHDAVSAGDDWNLAFPSFDVPSSDGSATRRFHLGQGPNQSLSAYYGVAKRMLHKAGGRDVTVSNLHEFTPVHWTILSRVCEAFVHGLGDAKLRKQLQGYPTMCFRSPNNGTNNRSLLGVFIQIEGERIVQLWTHWPARSEIYAQGAQAEQALVAWKKLQLTGNFSLDPVAFTKSLQIAFKRIKRIPSMQLVLLEQGLHESAWQYFTRAQGIVRGLIPQGAHQGSNSTRVEIISRYIAGIVPETVRRMVEADSQVSQLSLEAVGMRHKCLHLCWEFDKALASGLYNGTQTKDVAVYQDFLRSSLRDMKNGLPECRVVVPVPPAYQDLVSRIRQLQGPGNMKQRQGSGERARDALEFPACGAGVQCDINFSAHLALHNTALLRCYSQTDSRVRPMVLFIKHWAKVRGINSGYRGTLNSYGYVLMVLHYLVNVAQPFVCPNLQQLVPQPSSTMSPDDDIRAPAQCQGYNVEFWRNEGEILHLAATNQLNHNMESIGYLLRGFFEYFSYSGLMSNGLGKGFDWGRDVLSLRTPGGLFTKQEKGWTGAKTVFEPHQGPSTAQRPPPLPQSLALKGRSHGAEDAFASAKLSPGSHSPKSTNFKEIRHRYLFAIEDPFELDHNVARTVTHHGIVSIRDEFRRAWRMICGVEGADSSQNLLQDVEHSHQGFGSFLRLLDDIHGPRETRAGLEP